MLTSVVQAGRVYWAFLQKPVAPVHVRAFCPSLTAPGWWDCDNPGAGQHIKLPTAHAVWPDDPNPPDAFP